jgi:acyl dehydratase
MPLNRDFIGRSWRAAEVYEVSREKLREFACAIGENHAAYLKDEAAEKLGHPGVVAPPTFCTTLWFRMGNWPMFIPEFGKQKAPVCVLGDQRVTHHRPVHAGDRLWFATTVQDIRDIGRHELFEMCHEVTDEDGSPVCTIIDQMISRGSAAPKE